MNRRFSESVGARFQLPEGSYVDFMLKRCIHRRAIIFVPFLMVIDRGYFDADIELITAVGRLRSADSLQEEIDAFHIHPDNRSFARRIMCIRISTRRLRREFLSLMTPSVE